MKKSKKTHLGKPCDICGEIGYAEDLATCSQCNQACEHLYCMRSLPCSMPENWLCESCRSRDMEEYHSIAPKLTSSEKFGQEKNYESLIPSNEASHFAVASGSHWDMKLHALGRRRKVFESKTSARATVKESLAVKVGENPMLNQSDNMPLNGIRKPFPTAGRSIKTVDMGKNERASVPVSSSPSKLVQNLLSRENSFKTGETSKVKFISAEEAALLTSGIKAKTCPTRVSLGSVPSVAKRTPTPNCVPASEASKGCLQKGNSNSVSRPPGYSKPVTHRSIGLGTHLRSPSGIERSPSRVCKPSTSERLMGIDDKLFIPRPGAVKTVSDSRKVLSQPNGRSIDDEAYHSPARHTRCAESIHNGNVTSSQSSNEDLMLRVNNGSGKGAASAPVGQAIRMDEEPMLPGLLKWKFPDHLHLGVLWKGSFEIFDAVCHNDFCDGIEAHRPTIVHHKVCEVPKIMTKKLQFKLEPRLDIWPRIFQKECPTTNDIALYFFPGELDSSKKKYVDLLELIEMKDLAMRCRLSDVELLIFTSKQLAMDSQRLSMQLYLWGVFRHVKDTKVSNHMGGSLSNIPAPDRGNQQGDCALLLEDGDRDQINTTLAGITDEVDMEIDMIGGKEVGRIDKPVPRPVALKSRSVLKFPLHLNGHEASSPQHGSSNSSSYMGRKRVRFSIDTSTSNLGKTTNSQVLNGTNVLAGTYKENRSTVSVPRSSLPITRSTSCGSRHLIDRHLHGPYDGSMTPPTSLKDNRLELVDHSIPDVPPGFSKPSTSVAATEKPLLKSAMNKPAIRKVADVPPCFDKPINSKDDFCPSVAACSKEEARVRGTNFCNPPNVSITRAMDISPGFMNRLDCKNDYCLSEATHRKEKDDYFSSDATRKGKDEHRSSKAMSKRVKDEYHSSEATHRREKDEYHSFDATSKGKDKYRSSEAMIKRVKDEYHSSEATSAVDVSPDFMKQLDCEYHSLDATCRKEKAEYRSSKATCRNGKDECYSIEASKDEYHSSETTNTKEKAIVGSTEVGNHLKDAGSLESASFKGSDGGSGLQAQKSVIAAESPQVPLMCHQVSSRGLKSCLPTDSTADSSAGSPAHFYSNFCSESASCLQLFPLEIETILADNNLDSGTIQYAEDSRSVNGEESLLLSLSRPQYLKDGDKWISVLPKELLAQDGCGNELQLTL